MERGLVEAYLLVESTDLTLAKDSDGNVVFQLHQLIRGSKRITLTSPSFLTVLRKAYYEVGSEEDFAEIYSGNVKFGTMIFNTEKEEVEFKQERDFRKPYTRLFQTETLSQDQIYNLIK